MFLEFGKKGIRDKNGMNELIILYEIKNKNLPSLNTKKNFETDTVSDVPIPNTIFSLNTTKFNDYYIRDEFTFKTNFYCSNLITSSVIKKRNEKN